MIFLTVCLTATTALAAGYDYVEEISGGKIYWSEGWVTAEGKGVASLNTVNTALSRAMAERAALRDARNNLLNIIKLIRLDSANTVGTLMVQNDKYREEITALVQKASPLSMKYRADSSVEITAGLKLYGPMAEFYLNQVLNPPPKAETVKAETPKAESKPVITGLIIDARGLGVKPAFAPRIYDENGKEIWSASQMQKDAIAADGILIYVKIMNFAKAHPRVGDNPYAVKAMRAMGKEKVDLVLSAADARTLSKASETQPFLKRGRLIILLD